MLNGGTQTSLDTASQPYPCMHYHAFFDMTFPMHFFLPHSIQVFSHKL